MHIYYAYILCILTNNEKQLVFFSLAVLELSLISEIILTRGGF